MLKHTRLFRKNGQTYVLETREENGVLYTKEVPMNSFSEYMRGLGPYKEIDI